MLCYGVVVGVTQECGSIECVSDDLHSDKRVDHAQPEAFRGGSTNGTNESQTHTLDACGRSCLKRDDAPQQPTG